MVYALTRISLREWDLELSEILWYQKKKKSPNPSQKARPSVTL